MILRPPPSRAAAPPDTATAFDEARRDTATAREHTVGSRLVRREAGALAALGLAGERWGDERPTPLPMIARFDQLPDLAHFFDLEHFLGTLLGAPLDLTPEDVWLRHGNAAHAVVWVWQQTESTG